MSTTSIAGKRRNTKKVVDPKLPGRFGKMTAQELEADVAKYDAPMVAFEESRPLTPEQRRQHGRARNKGGRPQIGEGAAKVRISLEQGLLRRADAEAQARGTSRSRLIAEALEALLKPANKKRSA